MLLSLTTWEQVAASSAYRSRTPGLPTRSSISSSLTSEYSSEVRSGSSCSASLAAVTSSHRREHRALRATCSSRSSIPHSSTALETYPSHERGLERVTSAA
jgi:hypothetical protein